MLKSMQEEQRQEMLDEIHDILHDALHDAVITTKQRDDYHDACMSALYQYFTGPKLSRSVATAVLEEFGAEIHRTEPSTGYYEGFAPTKNSLVIVLPDSRVDRA